MPKNEPKPEFNPETGQLFVTPRQYSEISHMAQACSRLDSFDEPRWLEGIRTIVGDETLEKMREYVGPPVAARPIKLVVRKTDEET